MGDDIENYDTTLSRYTAWQLKDILKNNEDAKDSIKGLYKKKKGELIQIFKDLKIALDDLPEIVKREPSTGNILKKYEKRPYKEDEQKKFVKKGYKVKNALESKSDFINPKTGQKDRIKLNPHQKEFIRKFYMSNYSGAVVFHGVGTGKTLTAVVASHYYLSMFPDHRIIVLSPPSLIYNFINGMIQYGLDIQDNRYTFSSYEKFIRKPIVDDKCLIIVDEAHNFRTHIIYSEYKNKDNQIQVNVTQNKRGYHILEQIKKAHKCILLTGTPFINKLYDIENLISMCEKKAPLNENDFALMIVSKKQREDYFEYKISHYENETNNDFFPKVNSKYVPIVMDEDDEEIYTKINNSTRITDAEYEKLFKGGATVEHNVKSFYTGVRQLSNLLGHLKVNYIKKLLKKDKGQTIIYSTFIDNGLCRVIKMLRKMDIKYALITGSMNAIERENSRIKYNKKEIQCLLISKAGTEGVDTIGTKHVIIYEGSLWNEALVQQAIARAVRYKSHYHLPKKEQVVNVHRLLLCKENDVELIDDINDNNIQSYSNKLADIKERQAKINKILKVEKLRDAEELGEEGKKKYSQMKYNRYQAQNAIQKLTANMPSVEVYLTILSLSKQTQIDEFILELDKRIDQVEDYRNKQLEKLLNGKKEEQHHTIIKKFYKDQYNRLYNYLQNDNNVLNKRIEKIKERYEWALNKTKIKRYQEFFTPDNIVKKMLTYSEKLKGFKELVVLEPSAGVGNIVKHLLLQGNEDMKIDMVEIQEDNRKFLEKMAIDYGNLKLYQEGDFLKFVNPQNYDLIVMNPPYHLSKKYIKHLDRDYYDYDFVKKAYSMLKDDGELIALCRYENTQRELKWYESKKAHIHELMNQKWKGDKEGELSKINKINLCIIVMYKKYDDGKKTNLLIDETDKQEEKAEAVKTVYQNIYKYRR